MTENHTSSSEHKWQVTFMKTSIKLQLWEPVLCLISLTLNPMKHLKGCKHFVFLLSYTGFEQHWEFLGEQNIYLE